jgi:hypothetical protein
MFKIEGVDWENCVPRRHTVRVVKVHIMVARPHAIGEDWAGKMVFGIIIVVVVNLYQYPSYLNGFIMR